MQPLVSILIPAYNAEEWIAETLRSVVAQTWPRKEVIIVDDGSRDRTREIAQSFASASVRVIGQENQGAATTRNKAYSLCQGDYIQWLDADDLLHPQKIALQMAHVEKGLGRRTLLSSAWTRFMYRYRNSTFVSSSLWCDLLPAEWLVRKLGENVYMQPATWLVSRELSEAAGPWDKRLLSDDDGEYFCRVLLASNGTKFVPNAKVYYRIAGTGSLSYIGQSPRKVQAHWISMKLHIEYLRSLEDSQRARAACLTYLQTSLLYFYPERPDIIAEVQQLAGELGGQVVLPSFSWKYSWIDKLFGYSAAKRARFQLPRLKQSAVRSWDKLLFGIENRLPVRSFSNAENES